MPIPTDRIRKFPTPREMGAEIRRIRDEVFHWSQDELADMLGTTSKTVGRWENHGTGGVTLIAVYDLMRCWEVEVQRQDGEPK